MYIVTGVLASGLVVVVPSYGPCRTLVVRLDISVTPGQIINSLGGN